MRTFDLSDWLILVGLIILLAAIYLGLGGAAALGFLGGLLIVMGGFDAWRRARGKE